MSGITQKKRKECLTEKGVITVYCALVFLLLVALIGSMLESAHQAGIRVRVQQAADAGMDSLFSMYDRALFETYGLLFLNSGLGSDEPSREKLCSILKEFITSEADANPDLTMRTPQLLAFEPGEVRIETICRATEAEGRFFFRAVTDLMRYQETAQTLHSLTSYLEQLGTGRQAFDYVIDGNKAYEGTDWEKLAQDALPVEPETGDAPQVPPAEETGKPPGSLNQEIEDALEDSLVAQAQKLVQDGLLKVFVPDVETVSDGRLSAEALPSVTEMAEAEAKEEDAEEEVQDAETILQGNGLEDMAAQALYGEYLLDYFGSYRNPLSAGCLAYEIEYVLQGEDTDKANLLGVLQRILVARMGLNLVFLLGNTAYHQQAAAMAGTLVGWTGIAALTGAVTLLLLAVWAFAESVLDVRALLAGKRVPFYKTAESWTSDLKNCIGMLGSDKEARSTPDGLTYETYLRLFLLSDTTSGKYLRSMDVVQWNMALLEPGFRMKNCIYAMEISVEGIGHSLFGRLAWLVLTQDTWSYQVRWARSY